jgi:DNA-nicking Smr family endonuclease
MSRKKRTLSEDDRHLWQRLIERVTPQHPEKKRPAAPAIFPPKRPPATRDRPTQIKPFKIGEKAQTSPSAQSPAVDEAPAKVSPNMDKRNFQRLLRGKIEIDATLDLHGMTAEQARQRLVLSLQQAHTRGARLVLVITGKGKRTHIDEFNRPRSGVLRESLPDWLRSGALAGIVLQVTQAHPRHGGKGAFYVYLRRRR